MWHLARAHLRGVGHPDARFDPLELDLTHDGQPCDTVWWLENGGGKTSLLSLVFGVLRPATREFLGGGHKRSLADYVGTGDVAHVVLEWQLPSAGLPGIGRDDKLITGLSLEWPDLRAQPGNVSGLVRAQWGFRETAGYGLDQLPFLDEDGRPRRARSFAEQLTKDLASAASAQLHRPDANQSSWHEWLTDQDLDPEVFRFQLAMNHDEGAIAEEFSFGSGDAFVEWALKVAADPELPGKVAQTLEAVGAQIHRRPQLETELALCDGAVSRLETLGSAHGRLLTAEAAVRDARRDIAQLAGSVEAAASDADAARLAAEVEQEAAEGAVSRASADAARAGRVASRWRQLAALAAHREAQAAWERAAEAVEAAQREVAGWRIADLLAAQGADRRERERVRVELAQFELGLAPLKEQIAAAERDVVARAAHVTASVTAEIAQVSTRRTQLRTAAEADRGELTRLRDTGRTAQSQRSDAQARLSAIDTVRARAVAADLIDDDADPQHAAAQAEAASEQASTALVAATERRASAESADQAAEAEVSARRGEVAELAAAARAAAERAQTMQREAERLAHDELLIEATQLTPAEVWGQPQVTADRLRRLADDSRRAQIDATLQAAEIERVLTALEIDGYAPPSPDVATAIGRLKDVAVPAVAGYAYLTQGVAAGQRAAALKAAPDVAAGVVVTDPDALDRAYEALADLVPAAPLTLAIAATLADPQTDPRRVVLPPDPAVYDDTAAQQLRGRLGEQRESTATTLEGARGRTAAIERTIARYGQLHERWPAPAQVRRADADADAAAQQATTELAESQRRRGETRTELEQARAAIAPLELAERSARDRYQRLADLAEQWTERPALDERVAATSRTLAETDDAVAELEERQRARAAELEKLAGREQGMAGRRDAIADQLLRLALAPADAADAPDPGGTMEEHERTLTTLRGRLSEQRTEQGLASRLSTLDQRLADVAAQLAEHSEDAIGHARQLLDGPDGQSATSRRQAAAAATEHLATRNVELGQAEAAVTKERERSKEAAKLDTVELPDGTIIPEGSAELTAHAVAENERSNELTKQRRQHEIRAQRFKEQARESSDRHGRLTQTVSYLRDELPEELSTQDAWVAYAGTPDEASSDSRRLLSAVRKADAARSEGVTERQGAHHAVVQFVRRETFSTLVGDGAPTSKVVARLTVDDVEALACDADTVRGELVRRAAGIRQDLADVDTHRQLLIDQLVGVSRDAVGLLSDIQTRSRMPEGLAEWSKRRFIEIRHAPLPDDLAALTDRLSRTVDQLIADRSTPDGHQLLYRATRAAVGDDPFDVRIMKPHMDLRYDRVNITSLAGFSGGQKVTAAVALFTTMLNMRATARGKHGYRTTLLLDNPFGKSSADAFVHLQRQVAERLGIQLVFTTAVKDLAALSQFRRVIRLEHRRNRLSGALHVVEGTDTSQLVSASIARADSPQPEAEPDTEPVG